MPLLNTITTPYAEAFLQVAESRNEVEDIVSQSKSILDIWNQSSDFRDSMSSPVLEIETKKSILAMYRKNTPSMIERLVWTELQQRQVEGTLDALANLTKQERTKHAQKRRPY